jgi:hypothetical protein
MVGGGAKNPAKSRLLDCCIRHSIFFAGTIK